MMINHVKKAVVTLVAIVASLVAIAHGYRAGVMAVSIILAVIELLIATIPALVAGMVAGIAISLLRGKKVSESLTQIRHGVKNIVTRVTPTTQ